MANTAVNRKAPKEQPDFYRTPAIATEKLLEVERFEGTILEPSCGDGAISQVLEAQGHKVLSCDLNDWGYGITGVDFLGLEAPATNIITNPPYNLAQQFVEQGAKLVINKMALLLNLDFVKSKKRHEMFMRIPPSRIWVFSRQIAGDPRTADMMVKAWFVWDKVHKGPTQLGWVL